MPNDPWTWAKSPVNGLSMRSEPANVQAEQALLGAMLANNRAYEKVADYLQPHHFADAANALVYRAICERILDGKLADTVTLRSDFQHAGILDEVGGTAYLVQLLSAMVAVNTAGEYGKAVHDAWLRRQLIKVGEAIVNNAFSPDSELDGGGQLEAAERALAGINAGTSSGEILSAAGSAVSRAIARAGDIHRGDLTGRLLTGIRTIDNAIKFWSGSLTLLGGPPGSGKTALAVMIGKAKARTLYQEAIARGNSPEQAYRQPGVLFVSMEMNTDELGQRMAAEEARVTLDALQEGRLDEASTLRLIQAESALRMIPLRILERRRTPARLLVPRLKLHLQRQPELLVIIDSLMVMSDDQTAGKGRAYRGNDAPSVESTAMALKDLAQEMALPFIALTHTPRPEKGAIVTRPNRFNVKWGGEGPSDNVMFVHRPIMFMDDTPPVQGPKESDTAFRGPHGRLTRWHDVRDSAKELAEIVVAKQRQGPEGVYRMRWHGATTSLREWDEQTSMSDALVVPSWVDEPIF